MSLLLTLALAAHAGAIAINNPAGGSNSEESSGGAPVVGEGKAKDLSGNEAAAGWGEEVDEIAEETAWATEEPDYTQAPRRSGDSEGLAEEGGGSDAPVTSDSSESQNMESEKEAPEEKEAPQEKESLLKRLLVRRVEKTEIWKLVIPALGAAAALAALIWTQKKETDNRKTPAKQEDVPKTTIQSWDGM